MKIGDRVELIELEYDDIVYGLNVGIQGTIESESKYNIQYQDRTVDIFNVRLDNEEFSSSCNQNEDGTIMFYRRQLKVIE